MSRNTVVVLSLCLCLQACGSSRRLDQNGKPTLDATGYEDLPGAKADGLTGRAGLPLELDSASTAVWRVRNRWTDTDTLAARAPGIAWPEHSGLSWDEKFRVWVESMGRSGRTLMLTTPWGKTLAGPALECAELAMFLRIAFASWYELPFFMEAQSGRDRVFFGHFGIRTPDGVWQGMPAFKTQYADYSSQAEAVLRGDTPWPRDAVLRARNISGARDDAQPALDGAPAGAYFDEIFLNKRVGYFLLIQLAYQGSVNLADSANTFNLEPASTRPGDSLILRWQAQGIGHTYVVKAHRDTGPDTMELEVMSGTMPRAQPLWESAASSGTHFAEEDAGGPEHVEFGGGVKRWRVAIPVGGRWTNVVLPDYAESFIPTTDIERLQQRPETFERMLIPLDPEEQIAGLLELLDTKREHLRSHPSSCAARTAREDVFTRLYEVSTEIGMDEDEVDKAYRELEDYVFSELVYEQSKTCCWNSTTPEMYELIMELNRKRIEEQGCESLKSFMARDDSGDGYELFRAFAESQGRASEWVRWSPDESCPQATVPSDIEKGRPMRSVCDLVRSSWWDWLP